MKITLEQIHPSHQSSSFRWLINPKLNDFYYWHFHPEYELVFIEAPEGTRHVGTHISRFYGSDMVLIGSNIPHLNFDYGIKTDYEKLVLQVRPQFLQEALGQTPELNLILELLEQSKFGITFGSKIKEQLGIKFKAIPTLPWFEQFLAVLQLLHELATSGDYTLLHTQIPENQYNKKEQERLLKVYAFIEAYYQRKIDLPEVAQITHLSTAAFCRYFKKMTKLTFTEFLNHYRINQAKHLLLLDKNVSETCYACGFESLSYFNRTFKKVTGENPLRFKKRY